MIQTEHQITKAEIMCSVQKRMFSWKKQYSYYSSSKYVFILLHLFVFFVLYEEKLARLLLYHLKHRPNDLTYIETTQYLFRWEVRLPNKRPSDLEVQHQRLCICDLSGIAIEMIFDHKCELKYSFRICRYDQIQMFKSAFQVYNMLLIKR